GNRCPLCAGNLKTNEMFKNEMYDLVKEEYDLIGEYKTKRHKIEFKHNICNTVFKQYPETFIIGRRCPKCGLERRSKENHYKYNPLLTEEEDRKSTRLNSSHVSISYAVFCLKKKKQKRLKKQIT